MKTHLPEKLQAPGGPVQKDRRGVALITVLTFVALTTIMMTTFFLMAQNEHQASVNYSEGLQAQEVAESAVNIVIAQIREATSQSKRLWASQPGAIRTWSASGDDTFSAGYKLYSDDRMVVTGGQESAFSSEDFADIRTWTSQPAAYVDLNEPVIRGEKVFYPIVDPLAAHFPKWPNLVSGAARKGDSTGVEGFGYDENHDRIPITEFDSEVRKKKNQFVNANYDVLPMPVRWLYQLKDGSLGYLDSNAEGRGSFHLLTEGSPGPSAGNPIVARFAFWADDETCKLNPNYHAGGASWNTPLAGGDIDRNDGGKQPVKGEFQRYSGHPASTHLAPVLLPGVVNITNDRESIGKLFGMVPRIVGGGSDFGTRAYNISAVGAVSLKQDKDRLYASVDELLFQDAFAGQRKLNEFPTAGGKIGTSGTLSDDEVRDQLERMRFFLSVNSRAPEVNYMNQPRISMWPTYNHTGASDRVYQTAFDRLIRFCSQMGVSNGEPNKYYFERRNEDDMHSDYMSIERNRQLYAYLDWLTKQDIPGWGKSFSSKMVKEDRLQLLTQMFDFIRSTNLYDDSLFPDGQQGFSANNLSQVRTYTNPRSQNTDGLHPGFGQVTPIRINHDGVDTQGFGRFHGLQELGTMTICCADAGGTAGFPGGAAVGVPQLAGGAHPERIDSGTEEWDKNRLINQPIMSTPQSAEYSNYPPLYKGIVPDPRPDEGSVSFPNTADASAFNNMMATWPHWLKLLYTQYGTHDTNADNIGDGLYPIQPSQFKRVSNDPIGSPEYMGAPIVFPDEVKRAFYVRKWNWQLAMLDNQYKAAIWTNAKGRYDRELLTKPSGVPNWADAHLFNTDAERSRLQPGQKLLQSMLIFELSGNALGYNPINSDFNIEIEVNDVRFQSLYGAIDVPGGNWFSNGRQSAWGDHSLGGIKNHFYMLMSDGSGPKFTPQAIDQGKGVDGHRASGRQTAADVGYLGISGRVNAASNDGKYPYVTIPYAVSGNSFTMAGGKVNFRLFSAGTDETSNKRSAPKGARQLVQEVELELPGFTATAPALAPPKMGLWMNSAGTGGGAGGLNAMSFWSLGYDGANGAIDEYNGYLGTAPYGRVALIHGSHNSSFIVARHGLSTFGDPSESDVLRGVGVWHGDTRVATIRPRISASENIYRPHWDYDKPNIPVAMFNSGSNKAERNLTTASQPMRHIYAAQSTDVQWYGDFDNGVGPEGDGAFISKPDEGNLTFISGNTVGSVFGNIPYFSQSWTHTAVTPSYFTPNRIVCSPVAFGSLPRRAYTGQPWETLLFRPNVTGGIYRSHPGAVSPPDHLLLDLFWMPVVEPFAISEPLSTGGKVNLNYELLPFKHINRDTALRGVFKAEYMVIIPDQWAGRYKSQYGWGRGWHWRDNPYGGELVGISLRAVIEPEATFEQIKEKFSNGKLFKTASELCDIHLVPLNISQSQGAGRDNGIRTPPWQQMRDGSYWSTNRATGDNAKERPYNNIYPRVTTKSNTFKVHYRAQIIGKAKADVVPPDVFDASIDRVVAEYRGSSIVERYVEPNDPDIPDYAVDFDSPHSLDQFYKFRVVNPTRFAP